MKIVVFNHSFFYLSETFIYRQVTGVSKNIESTLLSFDFANEHLFPTKNKKILLKRETPFAGKIYQKLFPPFIKNKLGFSLFNYFSVRKILQQEKPDAIHAHFGFNGKDILPLAKSLKIPLIVSFHGVDASPQMLKNAGYKKQMQEMIRYASAVIVCSPHMIDTLEASAYRDKIFLVPYGVDINEFRKPITPEKNYVDILHSGRMVSKKGVPDLIRAFSILSKKLNNIKLTLIGDGQELEESKRIAEKSGSLNIEFLGAQPQGVVKKNMAEADIFVLNSRTSESGDMEGLPNAILEAMSMELPVVSTYHAGIPQAITDGINGMLVNERDNEALAAKLEQLITGKELRKNIGTAARQTIENKFTIENMNAGIEKVYQAVMASRQAPTSVSSSSLS